MASGDRCLFRTVDGEPAALHFDCDEWGDGTVTSILTGRVLAQPTQPGPGTK